jgi:hypothetical protein
MSRSQPAIAGATRPFSPGTASTATTSPFGPRRVIDELAVLRTLTFARRA